MSSSEPSYRFWCSTKSRVQSLNSISINTATKVLYVSTSSPVESCKFAYNLVPLSVLQLHCITFSCRLKGECVCIGIQFDGFRILIFYIEWNQLCYQFHCTVYRRCPYCSTLKSEFEYCNIRNKARPDPIYYTRRIFDII